MRKFQALSTMRRPQQAGDTARSGSEPDLARLILKIAERDQNSFRTLYDCCAAKLLGVALRIAQDRGIAEEIMQDAFLKVWRNAGTFDPDAGRAMTWLIAIVRYRAIDVMRSRGEAIRSTDPIVDHEDVIADPVQNLDRLEDADRLSRCLNQLDPEHRRCFVQAYVEGLSREELARSFNRPVNTIKTWLHRAAATLRTCLGDAR